MRIEEMRHVQKSMMNESIPAMFETLLAGDNERGGGIEGVCGSYRAREPVGSIGVL